MDGFLETFPAQIAILDSKGTILDCNHAWDRFARDNGYTGPSFLGLNYLSACECVTGVERESALMVADGLRAVVNGKDLWFEHVYPCHSPDQQRWFKLLMARHDDDTIIVTHVNITAEYLSKSFLAEKGFMANVVHDLRTPINAVRAYAEMIERGIAPNRVQEFARNIVVSADVLLGLVNDLLGAAESESGGLLLTETLNDVTALFRDSLMYVQPLAESREIAIALQLSGSLFFKGDSKRLRQILVNLLSNAVKYNRHGGRVVVRGTLDTEGGVVLSIADTGTGMTDDEVRRALQPFGRTLSALASGIEGSGLGLPFANHLLTLHEGRMHIDSTPGKGTTITLSFPQWRSRIRPASMLWSETREGRPNDGSGSWQGAGRPPLPTCH
jgi:signal transduction histidine kinase